MRALVSCFHHPYPRDIVRKCKKKIPRVWCQINSENPYLLGSDENKAKKIAFKEHAEI